MVQQTPQFIQLTVPEWISHYSEHVIVRGRVWETTQEYESSPITELASLRWEILDTDHRAEIKYDREGFFAFAIPTLGLPPVFYLRIVSVNRQGHTAEKIVALIAESTASQAGMTVPEVEEGAKVTALAPRESAAPSVTEVEEHRIKAPVLNLTDPRENDYFSRKLTIRGEVQDPAGDLQASPGIASLRWEVAESALGGELEIDESGKFSAVVDTSLVRRDALLIVRAVGSNGEKVERSVRLRADTAAPILQIFSPREGGIYDETVTVRGQVRDSLASNLTWKVIGESNLSGTAVLGDSGSFEFDFSMKGLKGTQILELCAEDAAANMTVTTVTLRDRKSVV